MKKIILLALLVTTGYFRTSAQEPHIIISDKTGWHKIGETTVNFKTETDEILVLGADRFLSVKIKVTDAPIHLVSFVIYFKGGNHQNVKIGKNIKTPGETRMVQLRGGERSIKKITFVYKTISNNKNKRAHVELWGLKRNFDKKHR